MSPGIAREDLKDLDIVDAPELLSDGTEPYRSAIGIVSVTAGTKTVVVSGGLIFNDEPVEPGDLLTVAGNAAAGNYTVASIVSDTVFTVEEVIADATGGNATFRHPPGATKVGVDPTNLAFSDSNRLQSVIEDLDEGLSTGHRTLRHLIHFIDSGPADGFISGAYEEVLPAGDPFPTIETWWESSSKLKKIVELITTWNPNRTINTEQWRMYDVDGSTVVATVTDTYAYSGVFMTSRTRAIS